MEVAIHGGITVGQLLKLTGAAGSGGQAKALLLAGEVTVNGKPEERRGRKLVVGDLVGLRDRVLLVTSEVDAPGGDTPETGGTASVDGD